MPSKVSHAGVYVQELPGGVHPIAGVATSVTAFIGTCPNGEICQPLQVSSFAGFERAFGGLAPGSELSYSVYQFFQNGGTSAWVVRVADHSARENWCAGIRSLDAVGWFSLLVLPGISQPAIIAAAAEYCERRRAFLLVDSPSGAKAPADVLLWLANGERMRSANAALYYPWIQIPDPLNNGAPRPLAPSGTIAGVIASVDAARGIWKAPAGTNAVLNGVTALDRELTDAENNLLNQSGVNCLRKFPAFDSVVWGAKTLSDDSEWQYVPIRRMVLFLEASLEQGTTWTVFEPNGEPLWAKLRLSIDAFMQNLFQQGAFQGNTPQEAYFVKCDAETTTQADIDVGVVNIVVGFAPLYPAEFVVLQITQMTG